MAVRQTSARFLGGARSHYVDVAARSMVWMLARPRPYGAFVNTKFNSISLRDFGKDSSWRNQEVLFGWIQGRALEALILHARFFANERPQLAGQLMAAAKPLFFQLAELIKRHDGGYFAYDIDLQPVFLTSDGTLLPQNVIPELKSYSDLYMLRGLVAGAHHFAPDQCSSYQDGLDDVLLALKEGRFVPDERVQRCAVPDADKALGPYLILMGSAALLARLGMPADLGDGVLAHVLDNHWDREKTGLLRAERNGIRTGPGQAMSFVGLALDYLQHVQKDAYAPELGKILQRSFTHGFRGPAFPLMLSMEDEAPLSPFHPWWPLPEAIRAASLAFRFSRSERFLTIWQRAHHAFFTHYWRDDPPVAYQTLDEAGPVDFAPATPDLDPGYHTGLSLLAAAEVLDTIR